MQELTISRVALSERYIQLRWGMEHGVDRLRDIVFFLVQRGFEREECSAGASENDKRP